MKTKKYLTAAALACALMAAPVNSIAASAEDAPALDGVTSRAFAVSFSETDGTLTVTNDPDCTDFPCAEDVFELGETDDSENWTALEFTDEEAEELNALNEQLNAIYTSLAKIEAEDEAAFQAASAEKEDEINSLNQRIDAIVYSKTGWFEVPVTGDGTEENPFTVEAEDGESNYSCYAYSISVDEDGNAHGKACKMPCIPADDSADENA